MKRKILSTVLIIGLLVSNTVLSYGNTSKLGIEEGERIYNNTKEIVSKEKMNIIETETQIIDFTPRESKSSIKKPLKNSLELRSTLNSAPVNTSNIKASNSVTGYYAIATSSSTVQEDYIYAKSRVYNANDVLLDSDSNSEQYSKFVSASAKNTSAWVWFDYAYGNHIYKKSGYKDVVHETYLNF